MTPEELRRISLFDILDDAQLARLAEAGEEKEFPAGAKLIRENEENPFLFVLRDGEVRVLSYGVEVTRLRPPSIFGEISTTGLSRPVATVEATKPARVWMFPKEVVAAVGLEHEEFGERLRDLAMARVLA